MTTYIRTLGIDFNVTEIHISSFYEQLSNTELPPILAIYQTGNDITIKFNRILDADELIIFNNFCLTYEFVIFDNIYAVIKDIKTTGTNGGNAVKNVWTQRDINTLEGNQNFVSIENNQFTLVEGTVYYQIRIQCPASNVNNHQIRLYDVTNQVVVAYGTSAYTNNNTVTYSTIDTVYIKGNSPVTMRVEHITDKNNNNTGFGIASAFNTQEIYTVISILRI